jgi:hypothetical protein
MGIRRRWCDGWAMSRKETDKQANVHKAPRLRSRVYIYWWNISSKEKRDRELEDGVQRGTSPLCRSVLRQSVSQASRPGQRGSRVEGKRQRGWEQVWVVPVQGSTRGSHPVRPGYWQKQPIPHLIVIDGVLHYTQASPDVWGLTREDMTITFCTANNGARWHAGSVRRYTCTWSPTVWTTKLASKVGM